MLNCDKKGFGDVMYPTVADVNANAATTHSVWSGVALRCVVRMRNQESKTRASRARLVTDAKLCCDCCSGEYHAGPFTFHVTSLKAHWCKGSASRSRKECRLLKAAWS